MKDVILAIRADEVIHKELNHKFADIDIDTTVESEVIEIKGTPS